MSGGSTHSGMTGVGCLGNGAGHIKTQGGGYATRVLIKSSHHLRIKLRSYK